MCACITALLAAGATTATAARLQVVETFNRAAGQTPENIAIADDGTTYISLAFASEILRISPDGNETVLTMPTSGGITVGVAIDRHHAGDLDVAVRSSDPAASGIWRISRVNFGGPIRIAALPTESFPNGITFDPQGNLYIADSNLGVIWRLVRGASEATRWAAGPALAPTGDSYLGFPLPGANGIKVRHGVVYVSNTSTKDILTVPIGDDGEAGPIRAKFTDIEADDFAFAANGDLYVTENPPSRLVVVSPCGEITTLATHADGLENPSAVAFDPRPSRRKYLYITNAAYFGTSPSLEVTTVGTVGQVLP
jgi:hypothetical protein